MTSAVWASIENLRHLVASIGGDEQPEFISPDDLNPMLHVFEPEPAPDVVGVDAGEKQRLAEQACARMMMIRNLAGGTKEDKLAAMLQMTEMRE